MLEKKLGRSCFLLFFFLDIVEIGGELKVDFSLVNQSSS